MYTTMRIYGCKKGYGIFVINMFLFSFKTGRRIALEQGRNQMSQMMCVRATLTIGLMLALPMLRVCERRHHKMQKIRMCGKCWNDSPEWCWGLLRDAPVPRVVQRRMSISIAVGITTLSLANVRIMRGQLVLTTLFPSASWHSKRELWTLCLIQCKFNVCTNTSLVRGGLIFATCLARMLPLIGFRNRVDHRWQVQPLTKLCLTPSSMDTERLEHGWSLWSDVLSACV